MLGKLVNTSNSIKSKENPVKTQKSFMLIVGFPQTTTQSQPPDSEGGKDCKTLQDPTYPPGDGIGSCTESN